MRRKLGGKGNKNCFSQFKVLPFYNKTFKQIDGVQLFFRFVPVQGCDRFLPNDIPFAFIVFGI
jgi:hypothetical protein